MGSRRGVWLWWAKPGPYGRPGVYLVVGQRQWRIIPWPAPDHGAD